MERLSQTDRAMEAMRFLRGHPQGATLSTLATETHCTKYEALALINYWQKQKIIEKTLVNNCSVFRLK